jgi:CRISPR-associated protein Cas1
MTERLLDISDGGAHLSVRHAQLVVRRDGQPDATVPLSEVAALVVAHPAVSYTQAVLSGLVEAGGVFIVCDAQRLPSGMLLPLTGHHLHTERLRAQVNASKTVQHRLWRQIVCSKVSAQAAALLDIHGDDGGLAAMAARVKPGDAANVEARAARRYWQRLFEVDGFRRDPDAGGLNALLNYGYAILRGLTARALVASGLHPAMGIHHRNRYNPYTLADDLMEPYRPWVDRAVVDLARGGAPDELTSAIKRDLVGTITGYYELHGEARGLFDALARTTASLAQVYEGKREHLILPGPQRPGAGRLDPPGPPEEYEEDAAPFTIESDS